MADYETLLLDIIAGLATITLNRPDTLNALNLQLKQDFVDAIRRVGQKDSGARCLLITGAGRSFCSGADLSESANSEQTWDAGRSLMETYHPFMLELAVLDMPIIAAVNGAAAGAGMSIAIASDIIIAAKSAYFMQAFAKIGLVPDAGSTFILPRLIGEARARAMMMLGNKVSAETAQQWGMVHQVTEDNALQETAINFAKELANGPTIALSSIRKLLTASATNSFSEQLQAEAMAQRTASQTQDFAEGVLAFTEKRPTNFTGR